jgi:ketosteroid isomerase-like protein
MDDAATNYDDGRAIGFDLIARYETADLACIAEIERYEAKVGGADDARPIALRVTSVLRRETDGWKVVHRHADPIMTAQSPDSLTPK